MSAECFPMDSIPSQCLKWRNRHNEWRFIWSKVSWYNSEQINNWIKACQWHGLTDCKLFIIQTTNYCCLKINPVIVCHGQKIWVNIIFDRKTWIAVVKGVRSVDRKRPRKSNTAWLHTVHTSFHTRCRCDARAFVLTWKLPTACCVPDSNPASSGLSVCTLPALSE